MKYYILTLTNYIYEYIGKIKILKHLLGNKIILTEKEYTSLSEEGRIVRTSHIGLNGIYSTITISSDDVIDDPIVIESKSLIGNEYVLNIGPERKEPIRVINQNDSMVKIKYLNKGTVTEFPKRDFLCLIEC